MRTLYRGYPEDDLIEGMFDEDGTLLDWWSPNDANWRSEYFNPFMRRLGFEVVEAPDWMQDKLREKAKELWGLTDEDVGLTDS